jgi:hypothetical protein
VVNAVVNSGAVFLFHGGLASDLALLLMMLLVQDKSLEYLGLLKRLSVLVQ